MIQALIGASALVLLASSVSVAAVRSSRDPEVADLLAEARRFVVENKTVSFRAETRQESDYAGFEFEEDGDAPPPEEATTIVNRSVVEGSIVEPDRSRSVTRSAGYRIEALQVEGEVWTRLAESGEELSDRKWSRARGGRGELRGGTGWRHGRLRRVPRPVAHRRERHRQPHLPHRPHRLADPRLPRRR